jgi:hypothetical protein
MKIRGKTLQSKVNPKKGTELVINIDLLLLLLTKYRGNFIN